MAGEIKLDKDTIASVKADLRAKVMASEGYKAQRDLQFRANVFALSYEIKQKALDGIMDTADNAYAQMQETQMRYDAAMGRLNTFNTAKDRAYTKFASAKSSKNSSVFNSAKAEYASACSASSSAETNADVLRGRLLSDASYSFKINQCAQIANSALT